MGPTRWTGIEAGSTDLRLVVARGAYLEGRVVDPDGEPVPGCCIYAVVDGQNQGNQLVDREGRFRILCREGQLVDLVAWPSAGALGSTDQIFGDDGRWDDSFNGLLQGVRAGTPDLVVRLPKFPPGSERPVGQTVPSTADSDGPDDDPKQ